jgi:hypothetical protein
VFGSPGLTLGQCPPHTKMPTQPCRVGKLKSSFSTQPGPRRPKFRPGPLGVTAPNLRWLSISPRHALSQARATTPSSRRRPRKPPPLAATQSASSRRHPGHLLAPPLGRLLTPPSQAATRPPPFGAMAVTESRQDAPLGPPFTVARERPDHHQDALHPRATRTHSSDGQGGKPAAVASSIRWL